MAHMNHSDSYSHSVTVTQFDSAHPGWDDIAFLFTSMLMY